MNRASWYAEKLTCFFRAFQVRWTPSDCLIESVGSTSGGSRNKNMLVYLKCRFAIEISEVLHYFPAVLVLPNVYSMSKRRWPICWDWRGIPVSVDYLLVGRVCCYTIDITTWFPEWLHQIACPFTLRGRMFFSCTRLYLGLRTLNVSC